MRPGSIAILAGGVVLLISTFLDWFGPFSAWESRLFGLTGLFLFLIAAVAIAVAAIGAFAPQVNLPARVLGFSRNQVVLLLGASAAIYALAMIFRDEGAKIGTILGFLAAAAIAVGAFLEEKAGGGAPASRPPQAF